MVVIKSLHIIFVKDDANVADLPKNGAIHTWNRATVEGPGAARCSYCIGGVGRLLAVYIRDYRGRIVSRLSRRREPTVIRWPAAASVQVNSVCQADTR